MYSSPSRTLNGTTTSMCRVVSCPEGMLRSLQGVMPQINNSCHILLSNLKPTLALRACCVHPSGSHVTNK